MFDFVFLTNRYNTLTIQKNDITPIQIHILTGHRTINYFLDVDCCMFYPTLRAQSNVCASIYVKQTICCQSCSQQLLWFNMLPNNSYISSTYKDPTLLNFLEYVPLYSKSYSELQIVLVLKVSRL